MISLWSSNLVTCKRMCSSCSVRRWKKADENLADVNMLWSPTGNQVLEKHQSMWSWKTENTQVIHYMDLLINLMLTRDSVHLLQQQAGERLKERSILTARWKANISSWPDRMDVMPEGAPPDPTLPSAETFRRSFPPSVSVSNWKLETKQEGKVIQSPWHLASFNYNCHTNKQQES